MNKNEAKTIVQANVIPLVGPALVFLSALLLFIKQSLFYIDLPVIAFSGVVVSWRWKWKGVLGSIAILGLVLCYDFLMEDVTLTWWDAGLTASIVIAFVITALASQEFLEKIRAFTEPMISKISTVEGQAAAALADKVTLERKIHELEEKLISASDTIQAKTEKAEMWERLVQLARKETQAQIEVREKLERQLSEEQTHYRDLMRKKEELEKASSQAKQASHMLSSLQQKAEQETILRKQGEEKIHSLTGQLSELTDRLKELQSEKEKLEKALDEALKPDLEDGKEKTLNFCQLEGMYRQLREQFVEKGRILDQTRKDFFHIQEQLLRLQKERLELNEYDDRGLIAGYEKHIASLESALQIKEDEVTLYEQLVNALSQPH